VPTDFKNRALLNFIKQGTKTAGIRLIDKGSDEMKKHILSMILLLAVILFCGCQKPLLPSDATIHDGNEVTLKTQYTAYSPDIDKIRFLIINNTDNELHFGTPYSLERLVNEAWYSVPFKPDTAWNDIGCMLTGNAKTSDIVVMSIFNHRFTEGRYRIVKEINGKNYTAEFDISKDGISESVPYGYESIYKLPKNYEPDESVVLFTPALTEERAALNDSLLERFLYSVSSGVSDQLRFVGCTVEGDYVIYDLIYEFIYGVPRITYIHDSTRDAWGSDEITKNYYRFIVVNDGSPYLSNYPEYNDSLSEYPHDYTDDQCYIDLFSHDSNAEKQFIEYFEQYSKNYTSNRSEVYVSWSPNGQNYIGYTDTNEFMYTYHPESGGYISSVEQFEGKYMKAVEAVWIDDDTVMFRCEVKNPNLDGKAEYYVCFDLEKGEITSTELSKNGREKIAAKD